MYKSFREFCERLLRIPPDPEPPPGDHASTQMFRAAPNFYRYLLFLWGLGSVGALVVVCWGSFGPIMAYVSMDKSKHPAGHLLLLIPGFFLGTVTLLRLFSLAVLRLNFEKRWYVVTDRSLRVREGVFNVREMTVTFANIQNISVDQGPVQRALGIADLKVETAGGGPTNTKHPGQNLHTAYFRGIDNAQEVRALIQDRVRHLKDAGLGDHEDVPDAASASSQTEYLQALREVHLEAAALRASVQNPSFSPT
jgi:uncharacterized membrane protein YdbT with pleckstrin-like domain